MSKRQKIKTLIGLATGIPIVIFAGIVGAEFKPADIEKVQSHNNHPESVPVNTPVSLISWNIQFAGSRKHHFFYDGGQAVEVPREDVETTLQQIQDLLKKHSPDIALLQEIDRYSSRTQDIDQVEVLRHYRNDINWAVTPYHKAPYVPHPVHSHLKRVNLNLGILSRFSLNDATRHQLALLNEPRWRQYFNLKRAILDSSIPIENHSKENHSKDLRVAVTHLSAFSNGDGTLNKQVAQLKNWMRNQSPDQPWILAGDFNLLPPKDDPKRLGEDAALYADAINPILELIPEFKVAFPNSLAPESNTYIPFAANQPDRKIDYIFYGGPIELHEAIVLTEAMEISDHLPLKITFSITN